MKIDGAQAAVSGVGIFAISYFWYKFSEAVFDTIQLLWDAAFIEEDEEEDEEFPVLPIYPDEKPPSYEESLDEDVFE